MHSEVIVEPGGQYGGGVGPGMNEVMVEVVSAGQIGAGGHLPSVGQTGQTGQTGPGPEPGWLGDVGTVYGVVPGCWGDVGVVGIAGTVGIGM